MKETIVIKAIKDPRKRFKLEKLLRTEKEDGYLSIKGLRKTSTVGYTLSNGENKITIEGKESRVNELIEDIKKLL